MSAHTLLLDMDGVLAEVSQSYRTAIVETCHAYGAKSVNLDLIGEWKVRGGCNNDWVLSRDLILASNDEGVDKTVTLDQVTKTFEKFYQGSDGRPGLCDLETLIPSPEILKELHRRTNGRIAIVTGRPHKDCQKFLKLQNIDNLVKCCVCMEDGPPKPNPFPVQHACKLLGVECSSDVIMVGDTPDDIRAAVACGCTGVGVTTPEAAEELKATGRNHDEAKLAVAMKECGASIILEPGFSKLVDVFPANPTA
mmetsp:Transcript_18470/g.27908  ORF Transcript_18470/g.27908 Transcript_18470/m.27908 type:complete len:252 (+) Transcript_18470:99-854(+)